MQNCHFIADSSLRLSYDLKVPNGRTEYTPLLLFGASQTVRGRPKSNGRKNRTDLRPTIFLGGPIEKAGAVFENLGARERSARGFGVGRGSSRKLERGQFGRL